MSGNFQNYWVAQPSMDFWREFSIECPDNTIGVELGDNVIPKIACKITIYFPCDKFTVKHYGGVWDPIKNKIENN